MFKIRSSVIQHVLSAIPNRAKDSINEYQFQKLAFRTRTDSIIAHDNRKLTKLKHCVTSSALTTR